MKKAGIKHRFLVIALSILALSIGANAAEAVDARVYVKNRMHPLYIQNFRMHFQRDREGGESIVFFIKEQRKYLSLSFNEIRNIKFRKVVGYGHGVDLPVFNVEVLLKETGSRQLYTMTPLKRLSGFYRGSPWEYDFKPKRGLKGNAELIDSIEFIGDTGF